MYKEIKKAPCPKCRENGGDTKGDNLRIKSDHEHCYACGYHNFTTSEYISEITLPYSKEFVGEYKALEDRGISKEVCELLGIVSGTIYNKPARLYEYNNGGKVRILPKDFAWIEGKESECSMFGLNAAKNYTKPIIITEGEEDAASCYEVGYQACSIRSGASEGERGGSTQACIQLDKEELLKYSEIWLGFDNDMCGKVAEKVAVRELNEALDRIRFIDWQENKDANEALLNNTLHEILIKKHAEYIPEGLTLANQIDFNELIENNVKSVQIPLPELQESMGGFDYGCLYLILAGVGIGKTTLLSNWVMHYYMQGLKVASLFYEEGEMITPLRYVALKNKVPVGKLRRDRRLLSNEQWEESKEFFNTDRLAFLSKKAKRTSEYLLQYITYLVKVKKFDMIIVDHISYIIGRSGVSKHGERRDIDELVYSLQELTQKLECITIIVSHVVEPEGNKNLDDGVIPSLYSGRGSKVLAQVPDGIIAASRNMNNEFSQSVIDLHCKKNRWGGKLGKMDSLIFYDQTGWLELKPKEV